MREMAVQTALAWAYLSHIMAGFAVDHDGYTEQGVPEPASQGIVQLRWYDDRSHYDSPFAFGNLKFDKQGFYAV